MALAMFVLVFAASAQTELPAIDEAEAAPYLGTGELKADATLEDFAGEWTLNGLAFDESGIMPASLFGITGDLKISESTLSIKLMDEEAEEDIPFELKEGKIYSTSTETDEEGNTVESTAIFEFHVDNSVHMSVEGEEGYMVFVRPENATTGMSFMDMLAGAMSEQTGTLEAQAEGQVEMTEEEMEAALTELFAQLEAEGVNAEGGNFDLNSLVSGLGLDGLAEGVDIQGLLQNVTNENGELDLSGILENVDVQGLVGGLMGGEGNEGSMDLSGLVQGLGGLFGGEGK